MDCVLLECAGDACSLSVSHQLWSWRSPETCANFVGHVASWKQIWEIMGRHIDEELWSFSESRPASHLAWQVMAGVVELEWSQQKSWNQPSFRCVCHLQQCWSDHVLFLWAWGCVDLGPQKRSSDKDVVPRRRWRFGDGRRLPSRVLPWCAGALHLERFEVASYVCYNARVGESWAAAGNCFAWRCWARSQACSHELHGPLAQHMQEGHGTQPVSTGAVQTPPSTPAPGEDRVSAGAAAGIQGTQPVVTGAVRVPAASVVDPKQSLHFTGIKKRGVEEEATLSVSTVKTSRSGEELLLERSDETIKSLLDCIEACVRQNDLFTLAITGTPLVAATQVHAEMLSKIDENVKNLRARLLAASEAVEAFSRCRVDRVQFKSLNLMELAAQQRRMIQRDLGNFYTSENSSWLIETRIKTQQNCLNKDMQYRKCLLSHRQLELLLETLSETMMKKYEEIAFDLRTLQRGVLPRKLTCAKRHQQAKQHQNEDLGLDVYDIASDSVLLVKALEVGYLSDMDKATRLQTVTGAWQKLLSVMFVGEIVHSLKQGLLTLLQHLRTMDVDRHFCDRTSEELASENYDIWVWMRKVTPWAGAAFGLQMWTCGPGYVVWVHAASAKIQPDCWCAWKTNAATPKEPWQRDHGHLVSRVGMT